MAAQSATCNYNSFLEKHMSEAPLFSSHHAIESLRESDFNSLSAFGEVIDNSLQANADNIRIRFEVIENGKRKDISSIAFADDGTGMTEEVLSNCLTLGWSSRYNDRDGIGRFGVGMTLGAIHECKRVEIWSKSKGGEWLFTYLDLDDIKEGIQSSIPTPVHREIPKAMKSLVCEDHGTLIVWRKLDRQQESADSLISSFRVWCGRTYRYFIWDSVENRSNPVVIEIDSEIVKAIDPLYARTEKTRFPEDPKADLYDEITIPWAIDSTVRDAVDGKNSKITIKMSKLPKEFRMRMRRGGSSTVRDRYIHMNNGISILRNHREVFYGDVPYWRGGKVAWSSFEEIDRWWGCEVHFSPEVDRAFQVKNIKQGAVPTTLLKQSIKEQIYPTRQSILKEVRDLWKQTALSDADDAEREAGDQLLKRAGQHDIAEKTAKHTSLPKSQLDVNKNLNDEIDKAAESYSTRYNAEELQALKTLFADQPFTIMQETWRGNQFFESKFLGGSAVLDYNMSHRFWESVYDLVGCLEDDDADHTEVAKEIRVMLDLLIISYAKAEALFGPDAEYTADDFIQQLRSNWGQMLHSFVASRIKELGDSE